MAPLDPLVAQLEVKECVFRINRDIRFSKDKAPYKAYMGAFLAPGGKKGGYAGYYLHLAPHNGSFVGGGIYQPSTETLKHIRQEIDYHPEEVEELLHAPGFRKAFGTLEGDRLKTVPRGYDAAHPQAALLQLKSYLARRAATDQEVAQKDFLTQVVHTFEQLIPLNRFLNRAVEA